MSASHTTRNSTVEDDCNHFYGQGLHIERGTDELNPYQNSLNEEQVYLI
jgi:hypothetical protein